MVIYGTTGNPFWKKVVTGANEMAQQLGVTVDIQYAEDDPERQITVIETAINKKVNGIGFIINIDEAYDEAVQKGLDAGIPMVCYNIDDSRGAEGTNPRMAFIGQDFVTSGYVLGKAMIEAYGLKEGDFAVCPVEHPGAVYAAKRFEGVKKALDEVGVGSEILDSGAISLEDTLTKITEYLLGNSETDAVIALGGMPTEMAPQAIADAGMDIPNGGFDLTAKILQNIIDGKTLGTVDQQPYYQGSMTVYFLWAYNKYGLMPCNINTGTLKLIDAEMAKKILPLSETHR
jgi:simple sugar transport system substrate-binding protein